MIQSTAAGIPRVVEKDDRSNVTPEALATYHTVAFGYSHHFDKATLTKRVFFIKAIFNNQFLLVAHVLWMWRQLPFVCLLKAKKCHAGSGGPYLREPVCYIEVE